MRNNKIKWIIVFGVVMIIGGALMGKMRRSGQDEYETVLVKPVIGAIQSVISTTGSVLPKNRLEVKPPVNGRIESILVKEGDKVAPAQTLAWMSSMERAALLDAAKGKGEEAVKYWQEVYKAIPLIAPIEGEVIVATVQPGQTVTTSDPIVVLSDKLIVRAQVDETDIAKIKVGQVAVVTIDAYPDEKINATVEHIYYESKTVNNVTMYEADLVPDNIPVFFRSGMNASIDFITETRMDSLLVPLEALQKDRQRTFVISRVGNKDTQKDVTTGLSDNNNVEILSGLDEDSGIVVKTKKYALPKDDGSSNPLVPMRRRPVKKP